jgi:hypothetical protein
MSLGKMFPDWKGIVPDVQEHKAVRTDTAELGKLKALAAAQTAPSTPMSLAKNPFTGQSATFTFNVIVTEGNAAAAGKAYGAAAYGEIKRQQATGGN